MAGRVIRLLFVLIAFLGVADIVHKDTVHALESDCHCQLDSRTGYNGGAFIYLDDWTFVDQTLGTSATSIQVPDYGAYYCRNYFCRSFANYLANQLCAAHGSGYKVTYIAHWSYEDPQNIYGGSGSGWIEGADGGPYECN